MKICNKSDIITLRLMDKVKYGNEIVISNLYNGKLGLAINVVKITFIMFLGDRIN